MISPDLSHRRDDQTIASWCSRRLSQIDVERIGDSNQRPEAVGELVLERGIQIGTRPDTGLALRELRKITDITNNTKDKFVRAPSTSEAFDIPLGIQRRYTPRHLLHHLKIHTPSTPTNSAIP